MESESMKLTVSLYIRNLSLVPVDWCSPSILSTGPIYPKENHQLGPFYVLLKGEGVPAVAGEPAYLRKNPQKTVQHKT